MTAAHKYEIWVLLIAAVESLLTLMNKSSTMWNFYVAQAEVAF